jgi:putative cell wall-binding protein
MLDAKRWIVVGDHETILRTNDGGATYAGPTNTTLPAVAITSPATGSSLGSTAVAIEGTSTDGFGIGVAKVEVRVRRGADNKYWNTSAWVTSADTWIAADRTDASNGFDAWNKTVSLPDTSSIGSHLYLEARATDGLGNFTDDAHLGKSTLTVAGGTPDVPPILVSRVSGSTRYATAVQIAKAAYPGWAGVRDVIIAGGEDARQPDALTAAGLAGAYSAPVILVPTNYLDADSRAAIQSMPAGVRLHIVGGTPAVSTKVANLLKGISRVKSIDRVSGIDRYATAVAVATRMKAVLGTHFPTIALLTNGQNPALAFDPLIASAVSANKHFPVLLTRNADVPASTRTALGTLKLSTRYIVGGTAAVSESSRTSLGIPVGNRIAGADVQGDAVALADKARQMSWLDNKYIGFAAKIPDAATGGAFMGRKGGALLLVNPTGPVPTVTSSWVTANKATITGGTFVFGGPPAVADSVKAELEALLN